MTPARRVAIAGAGMAGTSLACALVERGFRGEIVLLDERDASDDARTWCWWDVPGVAFRDAASHRWPAWRVAGGGADVVRSAADHPYLHLRGADFYAAARSRLRGANVRFAFGDRVEAIEAMSADRAIDAVPPARGAVVLRCASGAAVEADVAIDARGARPAPGGLVQRFVGRTVRTRDAVFDPGVATLMDFAEPGPHLARFTYVLPFARDLALVEDTVITTRPADDGERLSGIERYARETLRTEVVDVVAQEHGAIPMSAAPPPRTTRRTGFAGGAGGAVRASSGFAFVRTQRHVAAVADAVLAGRRLPAPGGARYRALDGALLALLRGGVVRAPEFFAAFFGGGDPAAVARFLSDASSPADDAGLLCAMLRDATGPKAGSATGRRTATA